VRYTRVMDTLPPELLADIEVRLERGPYQSVAELIVEALRALDETSATERWLEEKFREAEASPVGPMTDEDWDDIEREGLAQIRSKKA